MKKDDREISIFKKLATGLKQYLCDWRNLLGHSLIGIVFLVIAIWAPINIWLKMIIIVCLVCFNVLRMKKQKKKNAY